MITKTLYLVRHAEPIIQKGAKLGLSKVGMQQAHYTGIKLREDLLPNSSVSVLYAEVVRCKQTADIVAEVLGATPQPAALRLKSADSLKVLKGQSSYSMYLKTFAKLGVESPSSYVERLEGIINSLESEHTILVGNEVPLKLFLQHGTKTSYNSDIPYGCCVKVSVFQNPKRETIERIV